MPLHDRHGFGDAELGEQLFSAMFAVRRGPLDDIEAQIDTLAVLAAKIGLTPVGDAKIWRYPTEVGGGGIGHTIVYPVTESFLSFDVYAPRRGGYIIIHSCKPFMQEDAAAVIIDHGYAIVDEARSVLSLD